MIDGNVTDFFEGTVGKRKERTLCRKDEKKIVNCVENIGKTNNA